MKRYNLVKRFGDVILEHEEFYTETEAIRALHSVAFNALLSGMTVVSVHNNSIVRGGNLAEVVYKLGDVFFAFSVEVVEIKEYDGKSFS